LPEALAAMGPEAAPYAEKFAHGGQHSLTPHAVHELPAPVRDAVVGAYNDALVPVLGWLAPAMLVAGLVLVFIRPQRLSETLSSRTGSAGRDIKPSASAGRGLFAVAGGAFLEDELVDLVIAPGVLLGPVAHLCHGVEGPDEFETAGDVQAH